MIIKSNGEKDPLSQLGVTITLTYLTDSDIGMLRLMTWNKADILRSFDRVLVPQPRAHLCISAPAPLQLGTALEVKKM